MTAGVIFLVLICLAALLPMWFNVSWPYRIALLCFFIAYPMMKLTGFIGLLILWGLGALLIIHREDKDNGTTDQRL